MNIQTKLLIPTILLVALLVGGTGYVSYQQSTGAMHTLLMNNMRGEAESSVIALKNFAFTATENVAREASAPFLQQSIMSAEVDKKALSSYLLSITDAYSNFQRFVVISTKGEVLGDSFGLEAPRGFTLDSPHVQQALRGEMASSAAYLSPQTKTSVFNIAAPIKRDGQVLGAIVGMLSLETFFKQSMAQIRVGNTGYAYLLDTEGRLVAYKDTSLLFRTDLPSTPAYREVVAAGSGTKDINNNGVVIATVFRPVPSAANLIVVVRAEYDDVFSDLKDIRNSTIMLIVASVILGALLIYLITLPIVRSLGKGVAFANAIATGKLDGTLEVKGRDEVFVLASALQNIQKALLRIMEEYKRLEERIVHGELAAQGDASQFTGEYANLMQGTNAICARYRQVLDNIPSPVMSMGADRKIAFLNAKGQEWVGSDYVGKLGKQLFGREDDGTSACAVQKAIQTGKPATAETIAHPSGNTMDVLYSCYPMFDSKGTISSLLQLFTDLTAIKGTQRTIVQVAQEANEISNRVAAATEQLAKQVDGVSRGTEVQRDRAASTATAMEEMNVTVLEVARNAGEASEQAENTRQRAQNGKEVVERVIHSIQAVDNVAQELQENMHSLGKQAEAIGGIMNVISDIADQTNLLALNAAIEAARAGEAGRGFAVVADEVRKLAEKTMSATTEVGSSIQGIQRAASANIVRVEEVGKNVSDATKLASSSGEALHEILQLAGHNASLIASIATAAEEQSSTSEEISRSVAEVNHIAEDISGGMHESAGAVQEVARMAMELKSLLERLRA